MVSLALFIIVVLALVGSLLTVNDASRRVQAMRTVMDNLNFGIESMSRTIRTGTDISCALRGSPQRDCPISQYGTSSSNTSLSLYSTLGQHQLIEYRKIKLSNNKGQIQKQITDLVFDPVNNVYVPSGTAKGWIPITAPEIDIQNFSFFVEGAQFANDTIQPNVMIKFDGVATIVGGQTIPFAVQTYLSQRTPE